MNDLSTKQNPFLQGRECVVIPPMQSQKNQTDDEPGSWGRITTTGTGE